MPKSKSGYLSARDAVARLGVKPATLYAYVSRGLLRSVPGAGPRERLYSSEDVEALRARGRTGAPAAGALRWGEPVLESAITLITPEELYYRGYAVTKLAVRFEDVAELLWSGVLPEKPVAWAAPRAAGAGADFISLANQFGEAPQTIDATLAAGRALIRLFAASAGGRDFRRAAKAETVAESLLVSYGLRADARRTALVDQALVQSADHELNASTFAARIAAATGASLSACIIAALATLSGPRHGGATDEVERYLATRARTGEAPGFGHKLYPSGDPRARVLLAASGPPPKIASLLARERGAPNLDLGLVAAATALGLPAGGARTLFAIGRTAGWIAHTLEQRLEGALLRPRARYVGRPPR